MVYHIRRPPLNAIICIMHVRNCVMGATQMQSMYQSRKFRVTRHQNIYKCFNVHYLISSYTLTSTVADPGGRGHGVH